LSAVINLQKTAGSNFGTGRFFMFFSKIGLLAVYPNKEQDNYQNQRAQLEQ